MKSTYQLLCMLGGKEACVLIPYSDRGFPAIGFGHRDPTLVIGDTSKRITVEQALALLAEDLRKYEDRVEHAIKVPMLPQQNDAFVDFDFNTGAILSGSVDDLFNGGDLKGAMDRLEQYNKAKNPKTGVREVLAGLTARRARERAIFETADYGSIGSFMLYADGYPGKGVPTLFPPEKPADEAQPLPHELVFPDLKPGQYRVKPGDTLYGLAKSNALSVDALKTINGIKTDALIAGRTIWLAPPEPTVEKIPAVVIPPTIVVAPPPSGWLVEPGDGWSGTLGYQFNSVGEFEDYLEGLHFGKWRPQFAVLHNTGAPNEAAWDATPGGDRQRLRNLTHHFKDEEGWRAGPHLFIRNTRIFAFSPLTAPGTHSPSWNGRSWGIEMAADYDRDVFDPSERDTVVGVLAALFNKIGQDPVDHVLGVRGLHFHKEDPNTSHKRCPGDHVGTRDAMAELVRARMDGDNRGEHK